MSISTERAAAAGALVAAIDSRRNFALGIAGGLAGALVGAGAWAVITATTHFQIGYMSIGVAFLVGLGMRQGNGRTREFGVAGAILALLGSALGNLGALYAAIANDAHVPLRQVLQIPATEMAHAFASSFQIMDVVFYGFAAYFGYRYSLRTLTKDEVATLPA